MSHFVHPQGICETDAVGERTRIWAFAHVLKGAVVGADCNICDHVFIENDVTIGDRVTVKSGVQLWNGLRVEDDVFIGPNATFSNDLYPRSRQYLAAPLRTVIRKGASIGAGAVILPGLTIGQYAMVGAGSVVTSDVQPYAIVTGNPARVTGYLDALKRQDQAGEPDRPSTESRVAGVGLYPQKQVDDARGNLTVGEFGAEVPFVPARYYTISDVPNMRVRGEYALRTTDQFIVCLRGQCAVVVSDGAQRQEWHFDASAAGLLIPRLTWTTFYKFSADALVLVFASQAYDPEDYIRDYAQFLAARIGP
jgi:acetyltransferase-like isoleucine patch superfamily enzyme/dTDP-4-dehydrorhamnose 3,5-epimerase-like enzyme